MPIRSFVRWFALICLSVPLAALAGHAFELANKMTLGGPLWLAVQQRLYRGWGPVSAPFEIGALLLAWMLVHADRARRPLFVPELAAACCISAMLAVFFLFNAPVNAAVDAWTTATLPPDWPQYRWRWEFGHALSFVLGVTAFVALLRAALLDRDADRGASRFHDGSATAATEKR